MTDVAGKLIGQFAACLADLMRAPAPAEATQASAPQPALTASTGQPAGGATSAAQAAPRPTSDVIDLVGAAGPPVVKRLAPVIAGLVLLLVGWLLTRRPPAVVVIVPASDRHTPTGGRLRGARLGGD